MTFNLICRQIVADAAVRLHDAGIRWHAKFFPGRELHILYDKDTKRVNLVGFTRSAAGHRCNPDDAESEEVASEEEEMCSDMKTLASTLPLWYHNSLLSMSSLYFTLQLAIHLNPPEFDEKNNTSK